MVDFLDGIGFGTGLLIVGALISILILGYKYFKGFRKTIDDQAEERIAARETTKKIQASIEETNNTLKELTLKISNVENKVTDLDTKYSNTIRDITTDMCNMTNRLETNMQESNNADAVLEAKLNEYNLNIEKVGNNLSDLTAKTNRLIESDRESIKAYIAGIHKTATTDGYIDFHILSIVEHQYETYLRCASATLALYSSNLLISRLTDLSSGLTSSSSASVKRYPYIDSCREDSVLTVFSLSTGASFLTSSGAILFCVVIATLSSFFSFLPAPRITLNVAYNPIISGDLESAG